MKATVWMILTVAPVLSAAGAADCVTVQAGLGMTAAPFEPIAVAQVATGWQPHSETSAQKHQRQTSDQDVDLDIDEAPTDSHRKLMPGQKPGTNVTGVPSGYDAKHLNRLWGRFNGAKTNAKATKAPKSKDVPVRLGRWAR